MRKLLAVCLLSFPAIALAQPAVPRDDVIFSEGRARLIATNPTGTYSGVVNGYVDKGTQGVGFYSLGFWIFTVRATTCEDCDPGQFDFFIDSYRGHTYQDSLGNTISEEGIGSGILNPSAGVISFSTLALNCSDINPSNYYYPGNGSSLFRGFHQAGHSGEKPGTRLEIKDGFIAGRISGRDCYNGIIWADVVLRQEVP